MRALREELSEGELFADSDQSEDEGITDYKIGGYFSPIGYKIVGFDVSGVVKTVGSKVTHVKVGDEVYGCAKGSLAEVAVADAEHVAVKSSKLSFVEAAALPVAYITSLQGLRDYGSFYFYVLYFIYFT